MSGSTAIYLIMGVLLLGGVGFLVVNLLNIRKAHVSAKWPSVTGEIIHSSLRVEDRGEDGTRYSVDIRYQYDVLGQPYQSNRVAFGLGKSVGNRRTARDLVDRYQVGSPVSVHYDPDNPGASVLEHSNLRYATGNIVAVSIMIAVVLYFLLRNLR